MALPLATLVLAAGAALPVVEPAPPPSPPPAASEPATLERVVVVASRVPEPLRRAAAAATVVERDALDAAGAVGLPDLAERVPGLAVPVDPARFGAQGINLRGLDGNRVVLLLDGIPQPEGFGVGGFSLAGRDAYSLSIIDRIEVLRGPASTVHGSKALAGVVAATTRDPGDAFAPGEAGLAGGARLGGDSRSDTLWQSGHVAGSHASGWQWLAAAGRLRGHEADNRTWRPQDVPNPADVGRDALLLKLVRDAGEGRRWTWTLEGDEGRRETDVRSQVRGPGRYATTTALSGDDRQRRARASLALGWTPGGAVERVDATAWLQHLATDQRTVQDRDPDRATPFRSRRERRFVYDRTGHGLSLVAQLPRGAHRVVAGLDIARLRHVERREGREVNLATGASSHVILGEVLPLRDFPISEVDEVGAFAQDDWTLGEDWSLVAGLRGEWLRTRALDDALWREDNPGVPLASATDHSVAPKLGLRWSRGDATAWLQFAVGHRAPPFSDLNLGLNLPALGYVALPNPDLRPERSTGWELGLRLDDGTSLLALTLFDNRYRDLIESRAALGANADGDLVFQSLNRERARIRGAELEAAIALDRFTPALEDWRLSAVAAWAQGRDTGRDRVLESVMPPSLALRLGWDAPDGAWGAGLGWRGTRAPATDAALAAARFVPPGWSTWDADAWWRLGAHARLQLGLRNLADRRYWRWEALRGVTPTAADLGRWTEPGRSVQLQLLLDW